MSSGKKGFRFRHEFWPVINSSKLFFCCPAHARKSSQLSWSLSLFFTWHLHLTIVEWLFSIGCEIFFIISQLYEILQTNVSTMSLRLRNVYFFFYYLLSLKDELKLSQISNFHLCRKSYFEWTMCTATLMSEMLIRILMRRKESFSFSFHLEFFSFSRLNVDS